MRTVIVVTTPTGGLGTEVLEVLLAGGEPVRVIVPDPSRLDPGVRRGVEIVHDSHADSDVLAEAFAGADSVWWVVPPDPTPGISGSTT